MVDTPVYAPVMTIPLIKISPNNFSCVRDNNFDGIYDCGNPTTGVTCVASGTGSCSLSSTWVGTPGLSCNLVSSGSTNFCEPSGTPPLPSGQVYGTGTV